MKKSLIVVKNTLFNKIRNLIIKIFNIREDKVEFDNNDSMKDNNTKQNLIEELSNISKENEFLNELDSAEFALETIEYFNIDENYVEPKIEFDYKERDKISFFKMYENIKSGKLSLNDLTFEDATKVITLQKIEKIN